MIEGWTDIGEGWGGDIEQDIGGIDDGSAF